MSEGFNIVLTSNGSEKSHKNYSQNLEHASNISEFISQRLVCPDGNR